jgi:hypothetical protein
MHTREHHYIEINSRVKKKLNDKHNFWKKHWSQGNPGGPIDEKWNLRTMGDLPSEYVLIDSLQETLDSPYYYDFYAKKIDEKYYYLIGTLKEGRRYYGDIRYYQPEFLQEIPKFTDVTKGDFSSYDESECISTPHYQSLNRPYLYLKKYLIKMALRT